MGTYYQSVVDRDAVNTEEALRLAGSVLDWLIAEEIIVPHMDDCILGDALGHRPGPRYMSALEKPDGAQFLKLRTNGVEVSTTRKVSLNNQGRFDGVICPGCARTVAQDHSWSDALTDWTDGGAGDLACAHCGHRESVAEWEHIDPMGFGTLTFTFWDWPTLSASFVKTLAQRLGHRTIVISGKL